MKDTESPLSRPTFDRKDGSAGEGESIRVVRSEELLAGRRVVLIQHGGELYRLLVTRNDRLILQK